MPHDPLLKALYEEKLRGPSSQLNNSTKAIVMARRMGLPDRTGTEIYRIVTLSKFTYPIAARMVWVAQAIKYAADNREELKPQWK
jgi:hypothetical protein